MPGEPWEEPLPGLSDASRQKLKCDPIVLKEEHARILLAQFQETALHRRWQLLAVSIMPTHMHLVVKVDGDPEPGKVLGDFKSYASRALNRAFGRPRSDTWWTAEGSKRKLGDESAVAAAVNYVLRKQPNPLVTWSPADEVSQ